MRSAVRRRPAWVYLAVAAVVLSGVAIFVTRVFSRVGGSHGTEASATTAAVERRTLNATTQVNGTLGYAASHTLGSQSSYTIANGYAVANGPGASGSAAAPASEAYASAKAQYDKAVNALNALRHPTAAAIAQAAAQLASAQSQLAAAQNAAAGPTTAQLADAQQKVASAQAQLVKAEHAAAGPTAAELAQAQAAISQAEATLANDQAAVAQAETDLAACTAPAASPSPTPVASPAPTPPPCDVASLQLAVQQAQSRVSVDQADLAAAQANLAGLNSPQSQAEAESNLAAARAQWSSAQAALASLTASDAQTPAQAELDAARSQVASAQAALDALKNPSAEQLKEANDALSTAGAALDTAQSNLDAPVGVLTQLANVGSVVQPGATLYSLDGAHPAVLLTGAVPAWRELHAGISDGADVNELKANLKALGYASSSMSVDAHWDGDTTAAVERWQHAIGLPETGVIPYGAVVFQPGALRVTANVAALGATLKTGEAVLQATSTIRVVDLPLDPSLQADVKIGDAVSVELPDSTTTPGKVAFVSSVATKVPSSGSGSSSTSASTIDVLVTLDDPSVAGTLDEAPVTVMITTQSAPNVLAVPIAALLAQPGNSYALEEIQADGTHRLLPVTTGVFDDAQGLIQVTGEQLATGQRVVVPST